MTLAFPPSPTPGMTHDAEGLSYEYVDGRWRVRDLTSGLYLPLDGSAGATGEIGTSDVLIAYRDALGGDQSVELDGGDSGGTKLVSRASIGKQLRIMNESDSTAPVGFYSEGSLVAQIDKDGSTAPSVSLSILTRAKGDARYAVLAPMTNLLANEVVFGDIPDSNAIQDSVRIGNGGIYMATTSTNDAGSRMTVYQRGAYVFKLASNGNVQNLNNSYAAFSDERLKQDIVDAKPQLADLLALRVVNYSLKSRPGLKQVGLIAQEVQKVKPGLVDEPDPETGMLSVKYSVLVPLMLKALQETHEVVEALRVEVAALKQA